MTPCLVPGGSRTTRWPRISSVTFPGSEIRSTSWAVSIETCPRPQTYQESCVRSINAASTRGRSIARGVDLFHARRQVGRLRQHHAPGGRDVDPYALSPGNERRVIRERPHARSSLHLRQSIPEERGRLDPHLRRRVAQQCGDAVVGERPGAAYDERGGEGEDEEQADEAGHGWQDGQNAPKKRSPLRCTGASFGVGSWRRPTLPPPRRGSTIGADRLNDRVRDGNGCGPVALVASTALRRGCVVVLRLITRVTEKRSSLTGN